MQWKTLMVIPFVVAFGVAAQVEPEAPQEQLFGMAMPVLSMPIDGSMRTDKDNKQEADVPEQIGTFHRCRPGSWNWPQCARQCRPGGWNWPQCARQCRPGGWNWPQCRRDCRPGGWNWPQCRAW